MIDLAAMGHGAHLLGVAVLAPAESQRIVPLLATVDEAAAYAGVRHRVLIAAEKTPGADVQREGWIVLGVPPADLAEWKTIAIRHSGHCAWLALWDSARFMPRDWLLGKLTLADQGREDGGLKRVSVDTRSSWFWEASCEAPPLTGCTIITPGYEEVGEEAVRRFQKFTGLPVTVLRLGGRSGHAYKLALPRLAPAWAPVVFFDADLWLLRETNFEPFIVPDGIAGVPDPGTADAESFVCHDVAALGLKADQYFNSGLFIADLSCERVRGAFDQAAALLDQREALGVKDYGEQSCLNAAVQRAGLPFRAMPAGFNFFMHSVQHGYGAFPPIVHGLHGAGIALADKCRRLTDQALVFGYRTPARLADYAIVSEALAAPGQSPEIPAPSELPDERTITNVHVANNDKSLPILLRTHRALQWLRERVERKEFLGFEGVASCKCFLTYRAVEGQLEFDTWSSDVALAFHDIPPDHPLWTRWDISQRTAEFYLYASRGDWSLARVKGLRLLTDVWRYEKLRTWQPMVANVVRVVSVLAYEAYLDGNEPRAVELVETAVKAWTDTMGAVDWVRWPMRWAEMRDDAHALLNCMVIARACGKVKFKDQEWAHLARMNRPTRGEHPYIRLMREMGELNQARRLWA